MDEAIPAVIDAGDVDLSWRGADRGAGEVGLFAYEATQLDAIRFDPLTRRLKLIWDSTRSGGNSARPLTAATYGEVGVIPQIQKGAS